jgi:hypothetical protein
MGSPSFITRIIGRTEESFRQSAIFWGAEVEILLNQATYRVARFFSIKYTKTGKINQLITKLPNGRNMYVPNGYKIYQHSIPCGSKIYPNCEFWFENMPSGNPGHLHAFCIGLSQLRMRILRTEMLNNDFKWTPEQLPRRISAIEINIPDQGMPGQLDIQAQHAEHNDSDIGHKSVDLNSKGTGPPK